MNKLSIALLSLLLTPLICVGMEGEKTETRGTKRDRSAVGLDLIDDKDSEPQSKKARCEKSEDNSDSEDFSDRSIATTPDPETQMIQLLYKNIETRAQEVQNIIATTITQTPKKYLKRYAIVLDIDDTSIYSPDAYNILVINPKSPEYDENEAIEAKEYEEKYKKAKYPTYPIPPIRSLFSDATEGGLKVFFVTARPEKKPDNIAFDLTPGHKQILEDADYFVDNKQTFLICMPIEIYKEAMDPANKELMTKIIGNWKKSQHDLIEKKYGCKIIAVLDDQPENLSREKPGHVRIPCPQNPFTTPQKQFRRIAPMENLQAVAGPFTADE